LFFTIGLADQEPFLAFIVSDVDQEKTVFREVIVKKIRLAAILMLFTFRSSIIVVLVNSRRAVAKFWRNSRPRRTADESV
jgi:hypothetical protein